MSTSFGLARYGDQQIGYEVLRSPRRRTMGVEVYPDLRVVVRAPIDCAPDIIAARVSRRAKWIKQQLERFRRFSPRTPPRRYVGGETHLYLGKQYRLKLAKGNEEEVMLKGGALMISAPTLLTPERVRSFLMSWYRQRAREVFANILDRYFELFERRGCARPRIAARNMQRRWGSLSASGTMTLNVKLVQAPKICIEYVVLHELCHLIHKHHSTSFYRQLDKLMPDWERRKERLEQALL
jgi:predicted metal-dependent hydrolase